MVPNVERLIYTAVAGMADAEERRVFLDHSCRDDPAMRRRIEEMLELQETAEDFFEFQPAPAATVADETAEGMGACIGRYRLIERIGAGGCGVVYLAEQLEPVRRKVALKVVRLGMDTEGVIARFEMERQALASMDHPNIARVLDAGATDSGRPFFVMELVDGEKITDFCDHQRLDLRQRLDLFMQVCNAIQHAHQKGVIHRDIKPSNVLVRLDDGVPAPKVIDFGIAKATTGSNGGDATFTAFDQFLGTPAYMSPEQAAGGVDVDTRSDIHSLGVLLYELLVGRPPFELSVSQEGGVDEIRRILREVDPPKPSALLASLDPDALARVAADRRTEPQKLIQLVKRDLDWIVMKAMEKDRRRRYETANGLALDIQRHLDHEPVAAGPPGAGYRLGKLVRRNKTTFLAGGLTFAALLAGFGTSTWLFLRERHARQEQARLREVAETARVRADRALASEAELRQLAEYGETVAQAAVMLAHDDMKGADALLANVPMGFAPSSLEAAATFRAVGEWHIREGRWDAAAVRFLGLARAMSSVDPTDSDSVSNNLLPAAAALCHLEKTEEYEQFRRMAIQRFGGTGHPVVAEQLVKATLLLPPDAGFLAEVEPLGSLLEREIGRPEGYRNRDLLAWGQLALALLEYRRANLPGAASWVEKALAMRERNPARDVSLQLILAMVEQRSGHPEAARRIIRDAAPAIREKLTGSPEMGGGSAGFWFDWTNAGILLREASALVGAEGRE